MMIEYTVENLRSRITDFFETTQYGYDNKIKELKQKYPDAKSIIINWKDINLFDSQLSDYLLDKPDDFITNAEEIVADMMAPFEFDSGKIHIRIVGVPEDSRIEIRKIRKKHVGKYISVRGLVRKATEVRPKLLHAAFECQKCRHIVVEPQDGTNLREPMECYKEHGGCGKPKGITRFVLKTDISELVDTQKLEIQEKPEGLRGGAQPQRLAGWIEDDMCGVINVGDRVVLNGILRAYVRDSRQRQTQLEIYLDIRSFEMEEKDYEDIDITEEDEKKIKALANDPEISRKIVDSISPTIYGLEIEKEALALQLFGGVPKTMPDGTKIRGDAHILIVGDPGTAKSQLLRYISNLAPRGVYTSGKTASAAGLTAAAVKDDTFGEGRWVLEAGALVLADMGMACIDELDKMDDKDRSSMHEVMEQQTVSVSKAGITATLQARCTILGAANPKTGRFNKDYPIAEQIKLPSTLLSRFDLIFSLIDVPKSDRDDSLAEHIIHSHLMGEKMMERRACPTSPEDLDDAKRQIEEENTFLKPTYGTEKLKKYIQYARNRIFPVMTDEAMDTIKQFYVDLRKQAEGGRAPIPITPRQLEAIIRLSEARARMRLSKKVEVEDANRAIEIIRYSLSKVATEPGASSQFDIDIIATGTSFSQQNIIRTLLDAIGEMSKTEKDGVHRTDVVSEVARRCNTTPERVDKMLTRLELSGEVYCPKQERYRLARER